MEKANWNVFYTKVFCEICKEEVIDNNRPLGCLSPKGYNWGKVFSTGKAKVDNEAI